MSKRIDRINNFRYPVSQPTVFDEEELTVLELVSKVAYKINETVGEVNEWFDYLDNFVEHFDFELQAEVKETLTKWQNEGILDDIINSALNTRLDDFEDETNAKFEMFDSHLGEIAIRTSEFSLQIPEDDDTGRIQRALNSLKDGDVLLLTEDISTNDSLNLVDRDYITIINKASTISKTTSGFPIIKVSNCKHFTFVNPLIDGNKLAQRGIELINSPFSRIIGGKVSNIGNDEETISTAGIIIKEGCDFTVIRGISIDYVHAHTSSASSGIWIENFSNSIDPSLISKHILIDNINVKDIQPNTDADGVKVLCGSYLGDINLNVQNSYFEGFGKRAIKFQARGVRSFNNTFVKTTPNGDSFVDFQRGGGTSTDDKLIIDIPTELVPEGSAGSLYLFYSLFRIQGSDVEVKDFTLDIKNDITQFVETGLSNRTFMFGNLLVDKEYIENIKITNSKFGGYGMELQTSIKNFVYKDNHVELWRGDEIRAFEYTIENVIWVDNKVDVLGLGYRLKPTFFKGYGRLVINIPTNTGQQSISPTYRSSNFDYKVNFGNPNMYPLGYKITNGKCISVCDVNPENKSLSRYNALYNYAKSGDIALLPEVKLSQTDIYYGWICISDPDETFPRGRWKSILTTIE